MGSGVLTVRMPVNASILSASRLVSQSEVEEDGLSEEVDDFSLHNEPSSTGSVAR